MKVDVPGLVAAAQKLLGLATSAQGLLAEMAPLAADPTSGGAAARLDMASMQLWGAACAQAYSLHKAAGHLIMIAQKFGTQEELNAAGLNVMLPGAVVMDDSALATLEPVPPIPPDVRVPLPPGAPLSGESFSQLVHTGSTAGGAGFSTTATNNALAIDNAATTVREVAATVPDLWESPVGTAALAGRLNEHVTALNTIADRWFELAGQSRKHADDYSETVAATPKVQEFTDAHAAFDRATDPVSKSQAGAALGRLESRAAAEAARYAGVTETSTSPTSVGAPQAPGAGAPGAGVPAGAGAGATAGQAAAVPEQAQLAKAGAAEAGQAGEGAGQLAQMLPQALGAIGGMAGGMAGMAGQVPQALMQTGQGLAQAATQGMSGLASKNPSEAELSKSADGLDPYDPTEAEGGAGAGGGGGGGGDTHPAGALGPPVTPSMSHTPPSMPAGAAPPPMTPAAAGGSAMGGMPMGMPMGGMMHPGQGGDGADNKVAADKKVVTPPQPHTEPVTGRVSDRTAAAAEASRTRADSDTDNDDPPPRGPVLRRITLAPLDGERT